MLIVICHVEKFDIAIERVTHFELSDYFKTSLKHHNIEFLVARYGFVLASNIHICPLHVVEIFSL